jgi:hypothetical protein
MQSNGPNAPRQPEKKKKEKKKKKRKKRKKEKKEKRKKRGEKKRGKKEGEKRRKYVLIGRSLDQPMLSIKISPVAVLLAEQIFNTAFCTARYWPVSRSGMMTSDDVIPA